MTRAERFAFFIRRHMGMIGAALVAVAIIGFFVGKQISVINENHNRIIKLEQTSPCTGLTTQQCADKLFASLSPTERRQLVKQLGQRAVNRLERNLRRERALNRRRRTVSPIFRQPVPTVPPSGGSPGGGTLPPQPGTGGGGGTPTVPTPTTPRLPQLPPITVPPITVPSVTTPPITTPTITVP